MNSTQTDLTDIVEKDVIPSLHFPAEDVLSSPIDRALRQRNAERATALGNNYHGKLDIYFMTDDGNAHRVYTTVWASTTEHLTLKAGTSLPLRAVLGFDFY